MVAILALGLMSSCTSSQSPLPQFQPALESSQGEENTGLEQQEELHEATGMRINFYRLKIVLDWF
jgi:hypothetical protein